MFWSLPERSGPLLLEEPEISLDKDGSIVKPLADDPGNRKVLEAGVMPGEIAPFRNQTVQLPMHLDLAV